jgi:hypothetical protein
VIQGIVPEEQGHGYLRLLWRGSWATYARAGIKRSTERSSSTRIPLRRRMQPASAAAHGVTFYTRVAA